MRSNYVEADPHKSRIGHFLSVSDATMVREEYAMLVVGSMSSDSGTMYMEFYADWPRLSSYSGQSCASTLDRTQTVSVRSGLKLST